MAENYLSQLVDPEYKEKQLQQEIEVILDPTLREALEAVRQLEVLKGQEEEEVRQRAARQAERKRLELLAAKAPTRKGGRRTHKKRRTHRRRTHANRRRR